MRRILFLFAGLLAGATVAKAQTVATFDTLTLPGTDTCYVNYSHPGTDVGFADGHAWFPCVYDTGFGSSYWSSGFVYSNKIDTTTSGFTNQYSVKNGHDYSGTGKYVVEYGQQTKLMLTGAALGHPVSGFYITNSTYTYNSMRDGDGFAKKFGDTTHSGITTGQGTAPDWFKVTIKGMYHGSFATDSVDYYLADYRPAGTANDSIVRGWNWVNLLPLGNVDSIFFYLSSSDNGSFGMNTPAYFCMDQFTTLDHNLSVSTTNQSKIAVYPNPATNEIHFAGINSDTYNVTIKDITGKTLNIFELNAGNTTIDVSNLKSGMYLIEFENQETRFTEKLIKN